MPLAPWTRPGYHVRIIYSGRLSGATWEWVRMRKSEKVRIRYLAGGGFVGSVAVLDDESEAFPQQDTVLW